MRLSLVNLILMIQFGLEYDPKVRGNFYPFLVLKNSYHIMFQGPLHKLELPYLVLKFSRMYKLNCEPFLLREFLDHSQNNYKMSVHLCLSYCTPVKFMKLVVLVGLQYMIVKVLRIFFNYSPFLCRNC